MYPFHDTIKLPTTPSGCFWYFIGFCVFVLLVVGFAKWML
jgi:hypothetical protein